MSYTDAPQNIPTAADVAPVVAANGDEVQGIPIAYRADNDVEVPAPVIDDALHTAYYPDAPEAVSDHLSANVLREEFGSAARSSLHPSAGDDAQRQGSNSGVKPVFHSAGPGDGPPPRPPPQIILPENVEDPTKWRTGLFDFRDDALSCVDAMLCSYCAISAQYNLLYRSKEGMFIPLVPAMLCVDYCCNMAFWPLLFCPPSMVGLTLVVRQSVRRRYSIVTHYEGPSQNGTAPPTNREMNYNAVFIGDMLIACLCTPCAISQHHREMTLRGEWPGPVIFSRSNPQGEIRVGGPVAPNVQQMS